MSRKIKLSILDQSPINKGENAVDALRNTTQLAIEAEKLGYTRYWVSEHHNISSLAGTAPEILIAHLASHTKKIRVGAGGIMLPNHSALKMAENFKLLEALYPNRIDMGIGKVQGIDRLTASLLNPTNSWNESDFIDQLHHLEHFLRDTEGKDIVFTKVKAYPLSTVPQRWLLTSSGESAITAARFGLGMSYAQFINPFVAADIVERYRKHFKPSGDLQEPQVNIIVFAFCNEDKAVVQQEQAMMDLRFIQLERYAGKLMTEYGDIKDVIYTDMEQFRIKQNRARTIYAIPEEMKERIIALADMYDVDEIMLVSYAQDFKRRVHSYELMSSLFDL